MKRPKAGTNYGASGGASGIIAAMNRLRFICAATGAGLVAGSVVVTASSHKVLSGP
jgi:hypothetical protein